MLPGDGILLLLPDKAFKRFRFALHVVDGLGHGRAFIDSEKEKAGSGLLVDLRCRGGDHHADRASYRVFLRFHPAALILAGGGNGDLLGRLDIPDGIGGTAHAFGLFDGQDLVDKRVFFLVEQGLVGNSSVFDIILIGDEREDGILQGGFPGSRSGLDQG